MFDFGSPYDKSSLMHGSGYSFSKDLTSPTMVNIETDDVVKIQRERLSKEDVYETNTLYECEVPSKGLSSRFSLRSPTLNAMIKYKMTPQNFSVCLSTPRPNFLKFASIK